MFNVRKKKAAAEIKALTKQNSVLYKAVTVLTENLHQYNIADHAGDRSYNKKKSMVAEVIAKYKGIGANGNQILQRLVNLRVAFSVPNRLFVRQNPIGEFTVPEITEAKTYMKEFMAFNGLDGDTP